MTAPTRSALIDCTKGLACAAIVWHHLAFYGPMSEVAHPAMPDVLDWLYEYARMAVQIFLVLGGYLAAASLAPAGHAKLGAPWPSLPVVQGRTPAQYAAHARAYRRAGLIQPQMGVGSLLRRPPAEIAAICAAVRAELPHAALHLFGVGVRLLRAGLDLTGIASFDSASWTKRFGSDLEPFKAVQCWTGWSQAKLAVRWALPRYQQSLAEASVSASKTARPTACAA